MPTKTESLKVIDAMWVMAHSTARQMRLDRGVSAHRGKYPWEEGVSWELLNVRSYFRFRNEMLANLLDNGQVIE